MLIPMRLKMRTTVNIQDDLLKKAISLSSIN
jgi:hypothetical protein